MGELTFQVPVIGENKDEPIKVSSKYGLRVFVDKTISTPFDALFKFKPDMHHGIDYAVPVKTRVNASESGIVIRASWNKYLGEVIIIDHTPNADDDKRNIYSVYAHLSAYTEGITAGTRVLQGQKIAKSGNTGSSTGPHLHFAIIDSPARMKWGVTGATGHAPNSKIFLDPAGYYGITIKVYGTLYDLSEEEHKKVTESLDVKMHLDFINYSWYGDVYLGKKKVGRIDKDNLDLMAGLSLGELDEIMKTTSFPERGSVVI